MMKKVIYMAGHSEIVGKRETVESPWLLEPFNGQQGPQHACVVTEPFVTVAE